MTHKGFLRFTIFPLQGSGHWRWRRCEALRGKAHCAASPLCFMGPSPVGWLRKRCPLQAQGPSYAQCILSSVPWCLAQVLLMRGLASLTWAWMRFGKTATIQSRNHRTWQLFSCLRHPFATWSTNHRANWHGWPCAREWLRAVYFHRTGGGSLSQLSRGVEETNVIHMIHTMPQSECDRPPNGYGMVWYGEPYQLTL